LIFAKFGKDLFNISKVRPIGRKKVAQFFDSQCKEWELTGHNFIVPLRPN